jgi:hypothetical protein
MIEQEVGMMQEQKTDMMQGQKANMIGEQKEIGGRYDIRQEVDMPFGKAIYMVLKEDKDMLMKQKAK